MNLIEKLVFLSFSGSSLVPFSLSIIFKGTILLASITLITTFMRKNSAMYRHLLWMLSFIGLALLPVFSYFIPELQWPILNLENQQKRYETASRFSTFSQDGIPVRSETLEQNTNHDQETNKSASDTNPSPVSGNDSNDQSILSQNVYTLNIAALTVPFYIMLAGSAVFLIKAMFGINAAYMIAHSAICIQSPRIQAVFQQVIKATELNSDHIDLLKSKYIHAPVTLGIFHHKILLPYDIEAWSRDRLRSVFIHELAHIRRYDFLFNILSMFVVSFYWFHPLVWYAYRRIGTEREQACDDYVLDSGIKPTDYAQHLFTVLSSLRSHQLPAVSVFVAMARWTHIESRIKAVLDSRSKRTILKPASKVWMSVVLLLVVLPLAVLRPVPKVDLNKTDTESNTPEYHNPDMPFSFQKDKNDLKNTTSSGESDIITKNDKSMNDLNDGEERQALYTELCGKYIAEDRESGIAVIVNIYERNGELWGSMDNNAEERQLIQIHGEELKFHVVGESITITFLRNADGKISKLRGNIRDEGEIIFAEKIMKIPLDSIELQNLLGEISGRYIVEIQDHSEMAVLTVKDNELWGELVDDGDPQKLELIDADVLKFYVFDMGLIATFHRDSRGVISHGFLTDFPSGNTGTFKKIPLDEKDPEVKEKLQMLYSELCGEYYFEDIGDGRSDIFEVYGQNDDLWITQLGEGQSYRLYPASIEEMIFYSSIKGEVIKVTVSRDSTGKIGTVKAEIMKQNQILIGTRMK